MFERFTERARQVVVLAQEEARGLKHNYISTDHLLIGLLLEEEGLAARALSEHGVTVEFARGRLREMVGQGEELIDGSVPFTPRAKRVLELSLREALSLGHNYIGTEHLLLGLVRENEGTASRILTELEVYEQDIRDTVIKMLCGPRAKPPTIADRLRAIADELDAV